MARTVQDPKALEVKAAAMTFFHSKLYSSARINGGRTWRLSFFGNGINVRSCGNEDALKSKKLTSKQKLDLMELQEQFLRYLERRGLHFVNGRPVQLHFHIGSGVYSKLLIPIPLGA